jgi:hypothetical protein
MDNITTVEGLRNAIKALEIEQEAKELVLKEHFHLVYESLRPINIIKGTLKDLFAFSSSSLAENLSGTAFGEAVGLILRRLFVGSSGNIFRKLFGALLQLGITNVASKKSDVIVSTGHSILQRLFRKKEKHSEKSESGNEDDN